MSRVSGKPYFIYVLWSPAGCRFYIGISEDPVKRLQQHNQSGRGWSARYAPWLLVYSERQADYSLARRREALLKAQKRGRGFWKITGLDPAHFSSQPSGS
jgi:putative endonuclease